MNVIKLEPMKIVIVIIAMASIVGCKAQAIYPLGSFNINETSYYVKDLDNHHDLIVGTWRWEDGDTSFEVVLHEFEMFNYPSWNSEYYDIVFGKYTYILDGAIIAQVNTIEPIPNGKLTLHFSNEHLYRVVIKDIVSDLTMVGEFALTSSQTATLKLWNSEGVKINVGNGQDFMLPTNVVLTKQ